MVVDTSALVAIFANEPDRHRFIGAIEAAEVRLISAGTFIETSIVLEARYGAEALRLFDLFRERAGLDVVEVDEHQARQARQAYSRFGKGRHPAGLNFGDCFSYALAVTSGDPLLFKGDDFAQTDVESVF
jgi:ribonuclease VapC